MSPKKIAEKVKEDVFDVYHGGIEKIDEDGKVTPLHPDEKNGQEQLARNWLLGNGKSLITFDGSFNGLEATSVIYVQRKKFYGDNFLSGLSRGVARLVWITADDALSSKADCKTIKI